MWVFCHPLVTVRNDSTVKRSLGPMKVELTQGSYWDPKVICSEPMWFFQAESLPMNPSKLSKVFQIATRSVTCISSKKPAPHGT